VNRKKSESFENLFPQNYKFDGFERLAIGKLLAREETKMAPSIIVRLHSAKSEHVISAR
jgi:hypothetical protein